MSTHFQKGAALRQMKKYDEAETEFRKALAENPTDVPTHALLALTYACQNKFDKARKEARETVGLAPDMPYPYFVLSTIESMAGKPKEAEKAITEALRLDPTDPDYYQFAGELKLAKRNWQEAMKYAEEGLKHDPQNIDCLSLISRALIVLGKYPEAEKYVDLSLSLQPENPTTHASKGWILVHQGKAKEAIERFREALRMNPHSEWAYAGVVQAMKARNPIYYMLLCGSLSMSESSRGFRRTLYWICMVIPPLRALPFLILLITFLTDTAFTTLLRLDPLGRTVLQDKTRKANNYALIGIVAIVALIGWCCSIPPESHAILDKAQKLESKGEHAQAHKLIENSLRDTEAIRKEEKFGSSERTFEDTSRWLIEKNLFPDLAVRAFNDLGFSYLQENRYISAEAEFKNALATAKLLTDQKAYATALFGLAAALSNENHTQAAAANFEQSLSILKQNHYTNDPLYRQVCKNYAIILRANGDAKKANALESSAL